MLVKPFTTSDWAIGSGAADAMILRASLVSSAPWLTASTALRFDTSSPSTDASQRRTLTSNSPWVSPSKVSSGMVPRYRPIVGYCVDQRSRVSTSCCAPTAKRSTRDSETRI